MMSEIMEIVKKDIKHIKDMSEDESIEHIMKKINNKTIKRIMS